MTITRVRTFKSGPLPLVSAEIPRQAAHGCRLSAWTQIELFHRCYVADVPEN